MLSLIWHKINYSHYVWIYLKCIYESVHIGICFLCFCMSLVGSRKGKTLWRNYRKKLCSLIELLLFKSINVIYDLHKDLWMWIRCSSDSSLPLICHHLPVWSKCYQPREREREVVERKHFFLSDWQRTSLCGRSLNSHRWEASPVQISSFLIKN